MGSRQASWSSRRPRARRGRRRASRGCGAWGARAGARRATKRRSTSAGGAQKLAVVSWSSCAPVSAAPADEQEEARVEAARLGHGRHPARQGVAATPRSSLRPRSASEREQRRLGVFAARRAPVEQRRVLQRLARHRQDGRLLERLAARRDGEPPRRRLVRRHRRAPGARRGHAPAPTPDPRSAGSSLPPGNTTAPPRKPTFCRSTQNTSSRVRARRVAHAPPASRRPSGSRPDAEESKSSMACSQVSRRDARHAAAGRARRCSTRFCASRRPPRATTRRAPATRPGTRAPG